jgi:hypothetical protein
MVRFEPAPGDRGTEVTVSLEYEPPAGKLGAAVARLSGEEPGAQTADDLRRFKQVWRPVMSSVPRPASGAAGCRSSSDPPSHRPSRSVPRPPTTQNAEPEGTDRVMRATQWLARNTVSVEDVPEPQIIDDRDAIVRIT